MAGSCHNQAVTSSVWLQEGSRPGRQRRAGVRVPAGLEADDLQEAVIEDGLAEALLHLLGPFGHVLAVVQAPQIPATAVALRKHAAQRPGSPGVRAPPTYCRSQGPSLAGQWVLQLMLEVRRVQAGWQVWHPWQRSGLWSAGWVDGGSPAS